MCLFFRVMSYKNSRPLVRPYHVVIDVVLAVYEGRKKSI